VDVNQGPDEAFWRAQEKRRDKQFGQPCCTQSGMSWTMIDMPGNFAVVIHGEDDCLNCFHHHVGRSVHNYYSTRLTEEMLTTGRTEEALRTCLELIAEEQRPEVVIVLGTCPVEVIGDQFAPVVHDVAERTGIPMIPLRTSGLALSSQQQMLDWLFVTLAGLPEGPPVDRYWQRQVALMAMEVLFERHAGAGAATLDGLRRDRPLSEARVNLVGLPSNHGELPEPVVLLGEAGIDVNGCYPDGVSIAEWRAIRHASHAFVVDTTMYPRLLKRLREHGQAIAEVPMPVGLAATRRFYTLVGEAMGRAAEVEAALAPLVAAGEAALAGLRTEIAGVRVGVTVRMLANYNADNLAYEGLGEVEALQEMGLDVHLFVQGPPEESAQRAFAEALRQRTELPFTVFPGPWRLAEFLQAAGCQLAVTSDTVRNEAKAAGVPMLTTRSLRPYLGAIPANVELVRRTLGRRS
jgi:nitrogenase molybdenum-iron protein alpha/beta subunit